MTTAHRPTWKAAFGLADSIGKGYTPTRSYSARDLPGYLKLKQRQWGQGSVDQLKEKDFKAQLLKRQRQAKIKKVGGIQVINAIEQRQQQQQNVDVVQNYESQVKKKIKRPEHQDDDNDILDLGPNPFPQDEDSQSFVRQQQQKPQHKRVQSEESDSQDDDSQLLREYEKIKEQRQKQELFKRQQKHEESLKNRQRELLKGNPLVDSSYSLSKRWYEDTVFRNQAKKAEEKKNFVNDYVRSEFHRKFMHRFVGR